nr:EcsC family protein [Pseudomonas sp. MWU15-20650]
MLEFGRCVHHPLTLELPVSTTFMMCSVADVALNEGFDLSDFATKQACIEVFAMGGPSQADDATETGYYATRSFTTEACSICPKSWQR